jgi:hypothetical protein
MTEKTFTIDFHELAFLTEACIPPGTIARSQFWRSLTDKHWHKMTDPERSHLFRWIQLNPFYNKSLEKEEETLIFHSRFDPDNQYIVKYIFDGIEKEERAFMIGENYHVNSNQRINEKFILEITKFNPDTEY